jgi:hypothetical protein
MNQIYHWVASTPAGVEMSLCEGCGALVADRMQHDIWHTKTRSIV